MYKKCFFFSRHTFDIHLELPGGDANREHRTDPMWGSLSISQDDDSGSGKFRRLVIYFKFFIRYLIP